MMIEKELKRINNAYSKLFSSMYKDFFVDKSTGLVLFIYYLKYLRDLIILNSDSSEQAMRTATITAAVAEFDAYNMTNDVHQKAFHWNNFCELLKYNMGDWLKIDDSV
jgi:hypothetical protein